MKNKYFLFRDFNNREHLSNIGKIKFKNYKDIYLEASKILNHFYNELPSKYFLYKGVNIAEVARRDLHVDLSELLNNLEQLKKYQANENIIYKAEYKFHKILCNFKIKSKVSFLLSLLYLILDHLYFFILKIKKKPSIKFDATLKVKKSNSVSKKNVLAISLRSFNNTFIKLLEEIDKDFNCFWIKPEIEKRTYEKKFLNNYEEQYLKIDLENKSIFLKTLFQNFKNSKKASDPIHNYLLEKLYIVILQNHKSYLRIIDILEKAQKEVKPDAILVGLNAHWIYNICIQISKQRKVKSIYFQDIFFHEDTFHDVDTDLTMTFSNTVKNDLLKFFNKDEKKIIVSKDFSRFYPHTPFDLNNLSKKYSNDSIIEFKKALNVNKNKKIALFVGDPGELYNSKEHKYIDEYNFLNTLKNNKEYFSIIKIHPSDTSNISTVALRDSNNVNAIVSKEIDFYRALTSCDLVVSQSSTAVLEAIILQKFIILCNYLSTNLYKKAVDYGVAHYVNNSNEFNKLLLNKDSLMLNYQSKMNKYLDEVYSSKSSAIDTLTIFRKAIYE